MHFPLKSPTAGAEKIVNQAPGPEIVMDLTNLICSLIGLAWAVILVGGLTLTRMPARPIARTVAKRGVRPHSGERTLR